jgi:hypothetical protein
MKGLWSLQLTNLSVNAPAIYIPWFQHPLPPFPTHAVKEQIVGTELSVLDN